MQCTCVASTKGVTVTTTTGRNVSRMEGENVRSAVVCPPTSINFSGVFLRSFNAQWNLPCSALLLSHGLSVSASRLSISLLLCLSQFQILVRASVK